VGVMVLRSEYACHILMHKACLPPRYRTKPARTPAQRPARVWQPARGVFISYPIT
jgi:hypothetical protein